MTSVTILAHPDEVFTVGFFVFNSTWAEANFNDNKAFFEMLTYTYQHFPNISDAGLGGYTITGKIETNGSTANPYSAPPPTEIVPTVTLVDDPSPKQMYFSMEIGGPGMVEADIAPVVQPLVDKFLSFNGNLGGQNYYTPFAKFSDYRDTRGPGGVGVNTMLASRLWDRPALAGPGLTDTLRVLTNPGVQGLLVSGPAVGAPPPARAGVLAGGRRA